MIARYDLARFIPSFDFFSWLVMVKAAGATEIVIDDRAPKHGKWPHDITRRRIDSIVLPGPALAGLPVRVGEDGETICHPDLSSLVAFWKSGGRFAPLASVLPRGQARFTVTLRHTQRQPGRNSNADTWRRFAAEIGALVIDDYDVAPVGLHERMALYAGAQMNFFVVSGPSHLCMLGGYPCMIFDAQKSVGNLDANGVPFGENWPFAGRDQRLIWQPDDYAVIQGAYYNWLCSTVHA